MQLRLSILDGPVMRTVSLRAAPGTRWGDVVPALALAQPDASLYVEYAGTVVPLEPHLPVGAPPLINGATIRTGHTAERPTARAPVRLHVAAGPDVSGSYPVRAGGRLTVGRGPFCDIVVDDLGLSRHHLTVSTTRQGVLVEDASSTNGSTLGDEALRGPAIWPPGVPLRAGSSTFALSPELGTVRRGRADGAGRVVVSPHLRDPEPLAPVDLATPDLVLPTAPTAPSALGWLLPLTVSVLMAVVLAMPALLLFGLMAPAMSLGGYVGDRRRYRRECTQARARHRQATDDLRDTTTRALARETRVREDRVPDLATLVDAAQTTGDPLWSRRATPLVCRLGRGRITTDVSVDGTALTADHLPVEVDLRGGITLIGPPQVTRGLARSILVQLAVLHAPEELVIELAHHPPPQSTVGAAARASTWDWLAWLPHVQGHDTGTTRTRVRLVDLTADNEPARSLSAGAQPGEGRDLGGTQEGPRTVPIVLCQNVGEAPDTETRVVAGQDRITVRSRSQHVTARPDLLSLRRAVRTARTLAGLASEGAGQATSGIPDRVDFASIAPVPLEGTALARAWQARPRTTRFVLGEGLTGTVHLDLATDGPHALVAGTTGAGKSELLRTLVTSLALANRPDELVMVLVDYKGGSAFAEAAALPHVVGLITDLDPHLADRALTSLTAELKRRERVLADVAASDLPAYQALDRSERLARLVLVIDEFRALAEELPDFLDGLVRIAALGRSLGVHLVLATQRPGGVISADVRANVNLRIALRVRDGSDSYDVLDCPDAASLPEGTPGRALIRTGSSPPREVQVASTAGEHAAEAPGGPEPVDVITVRDLWAPDLHPAPAAEVTTVQRSTLVRAAAAAAQAADLLGVTPPASPWLPALPELVTLADLRSAWRATTDIELPLLLSDLPSEQRQPVHSWRPLRDGHLGVAGAARSGRSTVARSILASVLARGVADTHVYAFDLAGALGPLDQAAAVGALLTARDVARGCQVIDHLVTLVSRRQQSLAADGLTSLEEQRGTAEQPWPLVLVVVDGWPRFAELYGETHRGRPLEQVLQVLREGQSVGVVAVVTGDRSLLVGRLAPLLPEMWSLRPADNADLLMAGLTRAQLPSSMPPGRAVRLRDGVVGQVAVAGSVGDGAAQVAALTAQIRDSPPSGADGPARFRPLPQTVALDRVPAQAGDGLTLGIGGDAAQPVRVPVPSAGAGSLAVIGPPGSGRTTTLRALAASAEAAGWVVVPVTPAHLRDPGLLDAALRVAGRAGTLVTVDGLDRFAQSPVEDSLLAWVDDPVAAGGSSARLLAVTGAPEDFGGFRGLGARVQRDRTGVVLQPADPGDGSALGVSVPTGDEPVPGRGVLVLRGRCTAVQVALPPA